MRYYLYIYRRGDCTPIYIGITNDIVRRNQEHKSDDWFKECKFLSFTRVDNKDLALMYEGYLIYLYQTKANVNKSETWKSYRGNIAYDLFNTNRWFLIALSDIDSITDNQSYVNFISCCQSQNRRYLDDIAYMYGEKELIRL